MSGLDASPFIALAPSADHVEFAALLASSDAEQQDDAGLTDPAESTARGLFGPLPTDGELPNLPEGTLPVLADYGLLGGAVLRRLPLDHGVGLLPPDPSLNVDEVLAAWSRLPRQKQRRLSPREFADIVPLLSLRAEAVRRQRQLLLEIRTLLAAVSADYLALVSRAGEVDPRLLPVLREFPTHSALRAGARDRLPVVLHATVPEEDRPVADRLLRFAQALSAPEATMHRLLAENAIPTHAECHHALARQIRALDHVIHHYGAAHADGADGEHAASGFPRPASTHGIHGQAFSVFGTHHELTPAARVSSTLTGLTPGSLRAMAEELLARRDTADRNALGDYQEFRRLHEAFAVPGTEAAPVDVLRMETIGQFLALSAVDFVSAVRHRAVCQQALELLTVESPGVPADPAERRDRADAMLALAITSSCAIDVASAVPTLRTTLNGELAPFASPALRTEAKGLYALALIFFGEYAAHPQAWDAAREARAAHAAEGGHGSSQAPVAIGDYFLAVTRLNCSLEDLESLHRAAEEHSAGTVYRYYFHYVVMLASYVTGEVDRGLQAYLDINAQDVWPQFNYRMENLTQRAHGVLLAAKGDLAAARRELAGVHFRSGSPTEVGGRLHQGLLRLRLDLAVGEHRFVLAQTQPEGPFGEYNIVGARVRRYLGLSLLLRGTALFREGDVALAEDCFLRATAHSVSTGEWFLICAGETLEYRAWLERQDRAALPGGLDERTYDTLVGRPLFIQATLPPLTPQQSRILPLLAQGRSADSIAAELHITRNTMKSHLRRLYERLGARSREQAVLRAQAYGIFE